jgi:hypothetical protein
MYLCVRAAHALAEVSSTKWVVVCSLSHWSMPCRLLVSVALERTRVCVCMCSDWPLQALARPAMLARLFLVPGAAGGQLPNVMLRARYFRSDVEVHTHPNH